MSKTESAKPDTSVSFRTSIGGQALIEGILMRGPTRQPIVCRTQDGMVEKVEELHWVREKHPILGWPLIRGVIVFLDSMVKGMKALTYSADPAAPRTSRRSPARSISGSKSISARRRPRTSSSVRPWCSASRCRSCCSS